MIEYYWLRFEINVVNNFVICILNDALGDTKIDSLILLFSFLSRQCHWIALGNANEDIQGESTFDLQYFKVTRK